MFTEKAEKHIDSCRFCWMCRHICPVGLATGREGNNAKSKALLLSLHLRGQAYTPDMAEEMYQCCLCNACANSCETGYEPALFIREARREAVVMGIVPERIQSLIDRLLDGKDIYETEDLPEEAYEAFAAGDVLVYLGGAKRTGSSEIVKAFFSLLQKAGVKAGAFKKEPACGDMLYDLLGQTDEVVRIAGTCAEEINRLQPAKVVVLDPSSARMFKQEFPAWGIALGCEVVTATSYLADLIESGKLQICRKQIGTVTYHDPCHMARDLDETEAARTLIRAMGYELKEMFLHGRQTNCCGGQVVRAHTPEITAKIAARRQEDASRTGAEKIVTACPGCRQNLAEAGGLPVEDIIMLLDSCCS